MKFWSLSVIPTLFVSVALAAGPAPESEPSVEEAPSAAEAAAEQDAEPSRQMDEAIAADALASSI